MALAEALKSNTTLKTLEYAALPLNPPPPKPLSPTARGTRSFLTFLSFAVCRLNYNELGPEGGMALAEALKSNTTLEFLESAALPSNTPALAQLHAFVYFTPSSSLRCFSQEHLLPPAP